MASRVPGSGWTMPFSSEAPTAEPMTAMTRSMEAARAWGVSKENGIDSVRIQSERVGGIMAVGSDSSINYLLPSCVGLLFTAAKIPFQLCPLSEPISVERKKFFSLPICEKVLLVARIFYISSEYAKSPAQTHSYRGRNYARNMCNGLAGDGTTFEHSVKRKIYPLDIRLV